MMSRMLTRAEHARSMLGCSFLFGCSWSAAILTLWWCVFHVDGFVKPDTLDVVRSTPDGQEVYDDVGAEDHVNK